MSLLLVHPLISVQFTSKTVKKLNNEELMKIMLLSVLEYHKAIQKKKKNVLKHILSDNYVSSNDLLWSVKLPVSDIWRVLSLQIVYTKQRRFKYNFINLKNVSDTKIHKLGALSENEPSNSKQSGEFLMY